MRQTPLVIPTEGAKQKRLPLVIPTEGAKQKRLPLVIPTEGAKRASGGIYGAVGGNSKIPQIPQLARFAPSG